MYATLHANWLPRNINGFSWVSRVLLWVVWVESDYILYIIVHPYIVSTHNTPLLNPWCCWPPPKPHPVTFWGFMNVQLLLHLGIKGWQLDVCQKISPGMVNRLPPREARADINARVKLDGESHFCPLHDTCSNSEFKKWWVFLYPNVWIPNEFHQKINSFDCVAALIGVSSALSMSAAFSLPSQDAVYFRNFEMVSHLLTNGALVELRNWPRWAWGHQSFQYSTWICQRFDHKMASLIAFVCVFFFLYVLGLFVMLTFLMQPSQVRISMTRTWMAWPLCTWLPRWVPWQRWSNSQQIHANPLCHLYSFILDEFQCSNSYRNFYQPMSCLMFFKPSATSATSCRGANDISELLVRHGADIELRDKKQRTALEVAVESGIFPPR